MSKRRFPGIYPFQTDEQDRFFGRDEDIRDLFALILLEKMVVLFGKSGHGKSSLLNAGIIPLFLKEKPHSERRYEPVTIKFGAWQDGKPALVETARQLIENSLGDRAKIPSLITDNTLWFVARRTGHLRILLVFDQFEEFFTYPLSQQQRFATELGELMQTDMPVSLAERYTDLPEEEQDFLANKMDIKAVFAIREDRLHLLDKLKYPLPAIFARRYPLLPLTRTRAAEAITKPAALKGDFDTAPFSFSDAALNTILDYLDDNQGRIETNQLQIIAESFENKAVLENIQTFTDQTLGDLKSIVARYYQDRIEDLPNESDRLAARKLCEEGLAQEGDPSIRLSLHEAQIRNFYGIKPELLERLVLNRLLTADPSNTGSGYVYELPHDTLLEPIIDAKRTRQNEELVVEERKARLTAELRVKEAELQTLLDQRRRRHLIGFLVVTTFALLISIGFGIMFNVKKREADYAKSEAEKQRGKADSLVSRLEEINNYLQENRVKLLTTIEKAVEKSNIDKHSKLDAIQKIKNSQILVYIHSYCPKDSTLPQKLFRALEDQGYGVKMLMLNKPFPPNKTRYFYDTDDISAQRVNLFVNDYFKMNNKPIEVALNKLTMKAPKGLVELWINYY